MLHGPAVIFHTIRALTTPMLGMGKLVFQPYLPSARRV